MSGERIFINGIDADTGTYRIPPQSEPELSRNVRQLTPDKEHVEDLEHRLELLDRKHLGPREKIDPKDLAQAGWGIIYATGADPAVRESLQELVEHRRSQASKFRECRFREIEYRPDESQWEFLNRHEAGFGPADPDKVPYYLLLVGGPEEIPYEFQFELDVEYAVGRIAFDSPEEYAAYASAVVRAERAAGDAAPRASFFAARNPDDYATEMTHDLLVEPLFEKLSRTTDHMRSDWSFEKRPASRATKEDLKSLLKKPPAFMVSACHGVCYDPGDKRQLERQGALLCQDWPGPEAWKGRPLLEDHYFSARDVEPHAQLDGLVMFHFGCYGAGTTAGGTFWGDGSYSGNISTPAAPHDFVARLPQQLLARGASAMISHVDQFWAYSFIGFKGGERRDALESTLLRLFDGHPVGSAMDYLNRRYAALSVKLAEMLAKVRYGKRVQAAQLNHLWTASRDARNFVVFGDPAARLP